MGYFFLTAANPFLKMYSFCFALKGNIHMTKTITEPFVAETNTAIREIRKTLSDEILSVYMTLKTYVNRSASAWTKNVVPWPLNKLAKELEMSEYKFRKIYSKLYEYGLVDIVAYEESHIKGNKPRNLVIHDFPQDRPFEKVRSYEDFVAEDASSKGKGGRPVQAKTVDTQVVKKTQPGVVEKTELELINNKSIHKKDSLKSFVNKSVDNSNSETLIENDLKDSQDKFRSEVMAIAYDYYFEFRQKYRMTKDGFIRLFTKFAEEKIEDGSYKTIRNLKAYMNGVVGNIEGHKLIREYFEGRELLDALNVEEEVSEFDRIAEEYQVPEEERIAREFREKSIVDEEFLAEIRRCYAVS